jgi:hypothetical protein
MTKRRPTLIEINSWDEVPDFATDVEARDFWDTRTGAGWEEAGQSATPSLHPPTHPVAIAWTPMSSRAQNRGAEA